MAVFPVSISLVDAYGRLISKRFDVSAADHPAALTAAGLFMADLADVTGARILSYDVATHVVYTDTVTAGSNRDTGATVSVRTADNEKAITRIPAPEATIFQADGSVDLADAAFTAYMANFLAGTILVDDGETVTEVLGGRLDK